MYYHNTVSIKKYFEGENKMNTDQITTKNYRMSQLKIITPQSVYAIRIKISSATGDTNFLSVTNEEFEKIKEILINN